MSIFSWGEQSGFGSGVVTSLWVRRGQRPTMTVETRESAALIGGYRWLAHMAGRDRDRFVAARGSVKPEVLAALSSVLG